MSCITANLSKCMIHNQTAVGVAVFQGISPLGRTGPTTGIRKLIYIVGMVAIFTTPFVVVQRVRPKSLPRSAPAAAGRTITWAVNS